METHDFTIDILGEAKIPTPVKMSDVNGDGFADYVSDDDRILYSIDTVKDENGKWIPKNSDTVELAGPRKLIYFNPAHVHAAICTCGGICPGLNNVIRAIVRCLWYRYGVRRITGIKFGYQGLLPTSMEEPIILNPDVVDEIQEKGGTILGSARGGGKQVGDIVDTLERMNVNIFFTIGGDGTLKGAQAIADEITRRGLKISVVGAAPEPVRWSDR